MTSNPVYVSYDSYREFDPLFLEMDAKKSRSAPPLRLFALQQLYILSGVMFEPAIRRKVMTDESDDAANVSAATAVSRRAEQPPAFAQHERVSEDSSAKRVRQALGKLASLL